MGSYRRLSRAQRRRRDEDQQDPRWLGWLAEMDSALETFLAVDVPDMPADPFTAAGLIHAEQALMAMFESADPLLAPQNAGAVDRFQRYVGETFVRRFAGRWMNVRVTEGRYSSAFFDRRGFAPVVTVPFEDAFFDVVMVVLSAANRRSGEEWAWIYGNLVEDYSEWIADGRPSM